MNIISYNTFNQNATNKEKDLYECLLNEHLLREKIEYLPKDFFESYIESKMPYSTMVPLYIYDKPENPDTKNKVGPMQYGTFDKVPVLMTPPVSINIYQDLNAYDIQGQLFLKYALSDNSIKYIPVIITIHSHSNIAQTNTLYKLKTPIIKTNGNPIFSYTKFSLIEQFLTKEKYKYTNFNLPKKSVNNEDFPPEIPEDSFPPIPKD